LPVALGKLVPANTVEIRQPWTCACGARGAVRHLFGETHDSVMARIGEAHAIVALDCAAERAEQGISLGTAERAGTEEQQLAFR
jgi:hypothetical protein